MDRAGTAVRSDRIAPTDARTADDVGRRAALDIHFALRRGRTVITHAYAEPPYRVAPPFDRDGELHLIMTMSAPGVFAGDDLCQRIRVGPGARVRLTSQSALQIHPSPNGQVARTTSHFEVEESASLVCCWDPVIPFPHARFDNRVSINVAEGARLLWSDAIMAGREASGERWQFAGVNHKLAFARGRGRQLSYLERYRLEPDRQMLQAPWVAGGNVYFGTTLVSSSDLDLSFAERLHHRLQDRPGLTAAVDQLEGGLLLVRLAAERGAVFHPARRESIASLLVP